MWTALGPQANSGSPKSKSMWFLRVIWRVVGRTSNQTRWANKQTSSKQDRQTSRKEKENEKDKENEKEKQKEMEV